MVKNSPANVGDTGSVIGLGRSPAEENENPLKYSCLEKSHGQRNLTIHIVTIESDTTLQLK